jgi:hypothetical protein
VAGSGRRAVAALAGAAVLSASVSGCVSTQHKNARAKLVADRTIEGRKPLWLGGRSRDVHVLRVAAVRGRRGGALVVTLRNRGERALTDVPVVVGMLRTGDRRTELNGGRGLGWFQTHLAAIGAGETATWVFTTRRALPNGRPWAVAGRATSVASVPRIAATVAPASRRRTVRVALVNDSGIPQYGLQIYAVARAGGRVVAAGTTSVRHLGSRGHATARVALVGAPGHHTIRVYAQATIFE